MPPDRALPPNWRQCGRSFPPAAHTAGSCINVDVGAGRLTKGRLSEDVFDGLEPNLTAHDEHFEMRPQPPALTRQDHD